MYGGTKISSLPENTTITSGFTIVGTGTDGVTYRWTVGEMMEDAGATGVSSDADNALIEGADGKPYLDASSLGEGGGAVVSVNGANGVVVLDNEDVGAAATVHSHSNATTIAAGFLSAADKTILDGLTTAVLGPALMAEIVAEPEEDRDGFVIDILDGLVDADEIVKTDSAGTGVEGIALVEETIGDPSDEALGTSAILGDTIASRHFWRLRYSVSPASPLNINLAGSSTTPSSTNHTLNVRVTGITAAVPWQIETIADGLEDVEGRVTFINNEGNTNNCFPQNHATAGASVEYVDGVQESDLVVPTGASSELTVFYRIITTGATGVFRITGFEKVTA